MGGLPSKPVAMLRMQAFQAQFRSELGDQATRSLYRLRMATGGLLLATLLMEAIIWLSSGPGLAFWIIVGGGLALVVTVVVGLRVVLAEASNHKGKKVTTGDLARMGALVSGGQPRNRSAGE